MEGLNLFNSIDVSRNVQRFMDGEGRDKGRHPDERYASFDYCFNYFQSFHDRDCVEDLSSPEHIQESCLQLGFYLASWGMLRGSSFLLNKSVRFYERLVETISHCDERLWKVDVNSYTDENIALLLGVGDAICSALGCENKASDTLVTKIMLGVYANVPAFDKYVRAGLRVGGFTKKHLKHVGEFYEYHRDKIDYHAQTIHTLDFHSGENTERCYTRAKIVDMVGVMEGQ